MDSAGRKPGQTVLSGSGVAARENQCQVVPHTRAGTRGNTTGWIQPSNGQSSKAWGATGGNVGLLDGSVSWKDIGSMTDHTNAWSSTGVPAGYIGTW